MMNTLRNLRINDTFIKLATLQSLFDMAEPVMSAHSFTRSPYHVIAFLVAYVGATEAQRNQIIEKLNSTTSGINFDKSELDSLIGQLDWPDLLKREQAEFNPMDFSFTVAAMDFTTTIVTGNKGAFLEAVVRQCPSLSDALRAEACTIKIMEAAERDKITFITKVQEKKQWKKPFTYTNIKGSVCFNVAHFEVSDALKHIIDAVEEGQESTIGFFKINKGSGDFKSRIILNLEVPNESIMNQSFSLKLKEKMETSQGIYNAFLGLAGYCGLPYVGLVKVELESEAEFSEKGAGVTQAQHFSLGLGGAGSLPGKPTIVTIKDLNGTLFLDAGIAVRFSGGPTASSFADRSAEFYVDIVSNNGSPVRLYAQPLTAQQALQAVVEYVDLSSSAPQAALPWQAASAAPHGGAGASSTSHDY